MGASHRRVSGYARFGFILSTYYTCCQAEAQEYQHSASGDPGGCTSKVQPLDVSLNKPFKSYVRCYWSEYILEQPVNFQNRQKLKPPTKENVTSWISSALGEMQEKPDMVV